MKCIIAEFYLICILFYFNWFDLKDYHESFSNHYFPKMQTMSGLGKPIIALEDDFEEWNRK